MDNIKISSELKHSVIKRELLLENIIVLHFKELNALSILFSKNTVAKALNAKYSTYQRLWTIEEVKRARSYIDSLVY